MRFFLCLLLAPTSPAASQSVAPVVDVFAPPVVGAPMNLAFYRAQGTAAEIFSQIRVQVRWRLQDSRQHPGCSQEPMHRAIVVAFSWNTPSDLHSGALAFSEFHTTGAVCVTVLMDRLKPMAEHSPVSTAFLLGHVLAHEMGHVLQGKLRHSTTGVLKEHWSPMEIRRMQAERLRFTDYDADLILEGFRACSSSPTGVTAGCATQE